MRLAVVAGALLLLGVTVRTGIDFYTSAIYLAKTDGYAAAKARYAPRTPQVSGAIAHSICAGSFAADAAASFDPSMNVTQADLDAYTTAAQDKDRVCTETAYLGSVQNADGSTDEIYRLTTSGIEHWYVFTMAGGLVQSIQ